MPKTSPPGPAAADAVMVPFGNVSGFVRQLTHDIRNGLNTLDLQTAFVQELLPADAEAADELKRLRALITSTAKNLQSLSGTFWIGEPRLVTYEAKMFMEDFRGRLDRLLPETRPEIAWRSTLGEEAVAIDLEMITRAFGEVFKNAAHFHEKGRPVSAQVQAQGGRFILELREGKSALASAPATWGREPLVSTRRGGYGMGLFHARRLLAAHDGTLDFAFDPAAQELTTRLTLPLATD